MTFIIQMVAFLFCLYNTLGTNSSKMFLNFLLPLKLQPRFVIKPFCYPERNPHQTNVTGHELADAFQYVSYAMMITILKIITFLIKIILNFSSWCVYFKIILRHL